MLINVLFRVFVLNLVACSMLFSLQALPGNEDDFFEIKSSSFFVFKDPDALGKATDTLIKGNEWNGKKTCPLYINYPFTLKEEDLPYIERWLKLKCYFGVATQNDSAEYDLIYPWYTSLANNPTVAKVFDPHKLIWLSMHATLFETQFHNIDISKDWLANHTNYHLERSHYYQIDAISGALRKETVKSPTL